jgi:hypothetical protein
MPLLINHSHTPSFDDRTRFDYNRYMQQLQHKLGDYSLFSQNDSITRDRLNNFHQQAEADSLMRQAGYPGGHQFIGITDMQQEEPLSQTHEQHVSAGLHLSRHTARGFRDKILQKLGNAQLEDSKVNS